jgi:non-specific serine/threonine protein kinase
MRSLLRRLSVSSGLSRSKPCASEPPTPWYHPLTKRQAEVAELIAAGSTNFEIATRIGDHRRVIGGRVALIMNKQGVSKRAEIAAWVAQHGPA